MKTMKAIMAAIIVAAGILFGCGSSANVTVGGSTGWDLSTNLTYWSQSTLVFVNDTLQFNYDPSHDVIEVNEAGFATCNTSTAFGGYYDINGKSRKTTLISLTKPGERFFICGRSNHCSLGLKLHVQVLDSRNTSSSSYPADDPDERTLPADGPNHEHRNHIPHSSSGAKAEFCLPLWAWVNWWFVSSYFFCFSWIPPFLLGS